jgi:hypothetical protein
MDVREVCDDGRSSFVKDKVVRPEMVADLLYGGIFSFIRGAPPRCR